MKERTTQGGKRQGAGRPLTEPTQVVRIPYSLLDTVNAMIAAHKGKEAQRQAKKAAQIKNVSIPEQSIEVVYSCGCALNDTLFRRANGCRLERLKH